MKCPQCGRELQNNETFCPGCGCRVENSSDNRQSGEQPQNPNNQSQYPYDTPPYPPVYRRNPPSKIGKTVRAFIAVLLFVGLMFGCQSCVMSGYITSLMLHEGVAVDMDADALIRQTEHYIEATNEKIVQILLIANLLTIFIICLLFRMRGKEPVREMRILSVNPFRLPTFALFGVALNIFVSVTLSFIPMPESVLESFDSQYSSLYGETSVALEIFSVAVVAGVVEELIFRGLAMSRLKPVIGRGGAVIVSAVLFGLAHGTPIAIGYALVLGIIFALLYEAFDSVIPTMVCHVFFNATSYALALVPEEKSVLLLGLYVLSIAAIIWCSYRMFVRRPTFNDMIIDKSHRIKPINEEEARIIARVNEIQSSGEIDERLIDEVEELQRLWEENRKRRK